MGSAIQPWTFPMTRGLMASCSRAAFNETGDVPSCKERRWIDWAAMTEDEDTSNDTKATYYIPKCQPTS